MKRERTIENRVRARQHARTHPLEVVYRGMMQRCGHWKSGRNREYILSRYEYRGIRVCEEWRKGFRKFEEWGLAHGWKKGLQIDRIDNNGDYSPENCRFVTPKVNSNNRSTNSTIYYNGKDISIMNFMAIAETHGIKRNTVYSRIRMGWTAEEIISISNGRKIERGGRKSRLGNPRTFFEYKGSMLTISEIARIAGMSKSGTRERLIKRGMTVEQVISTPSRKRESSEKLRSNRPA